MGNFWNAVSKFASELGASMTEKASTVFDHSSLLLTGQEMPLWGSGPDAAFENSWVAYSCIRKLATEGAGVPLLFLSDPDDPESEVGDDHPTKRLFLRPNPFFSHAEFIAWHLNTLNRRGESFIVFDDPVRPSMMYSHTEPKSWRELVLDSGELEGWEFRSKQGRVYRYAPGEVMQQRFINPARPFRGLSPASVVADALHIHTGADTLTRDVIERGGEKSIVYQAEHEVTEVQRDQTVQALRARHQRNSRVSRDVLLPNGVRPIDPKYIDDDLRILDAANAQPDKVCAVYGVPKSLLGFEDIDKFATFEGRIKMFYTSTLIPMLTDTESMFDAYFVERMPSAYNCYVRFDWNAMPAMQEDIGDRFEVAGKAHAAGLPWSVCNERFGLGLDESKIPGADTVMVSGTLAPLDKLLEEWDSPKPEPDPSPIPAGDDDGGEEPDDGPAPEATEEDAEEAPTKALTNAVIRKRASNTRSRVQRHQRQLKRERDMTKKWGALMREYQSKSLRAVAKVDHTSVREVKAALKSAFEGLPKKAGALANDYHIESAQEGSQSIVELVEGKMSDSQLASYKATYQWRPDVDKFIRTRENFIVGLTNEQLFADIVEHSVAAVKSGVEAHELQHIIRTRWASAPGGINRATTIARTEVGTAYNVSRYAEMKGQGFKLHQWQTAGDEVVRTPPESEFDHAICHDQVVKVGEGRFSCGLFYPMEQSGEPGNVINCRCETIPVVEEDR